MVKRGENNRIEGVFLLKSLHPCLFLRYRLVSFWLRHPWWGCPKLCKSQQERFESKQLLGFLFPSDPTSLPPPPPPPRGSDAPPRPFSGGQVGVVPTPLPPSGQAGPRVFSVQLFERTSPEREVSSWTYGFPGSGRPGDSFLCPAQTIYGSPRQVGGGLGPHRPPPHFFGSFDVSRAAAERVPLLN